MTEHRVAVVVFCTVDAVDTTEARYIAARAVRQTIHNSSQAQGENLFVRTILYRPRLTADPDPVTVHDVRELGHATYGGLLGFEVTNRAYPREDTDA
jgi:hypothetical protein